MQDIFRFDRRGIDADGKVIGELKPTGIRPKFMEALNARGIDLAASIFDPYRRLEGAA